MSSGNLLEICLAGLVDTMPVIMSTIDLCAVNFTCLCRISVRLADVEYLQTAFAFSTKSKPADRLFLCRQPVGTTADRFAVVVLC